MPDIQELARAFRYGSLDLPDPGMQYTPDAVRDFYTNVHPELATAAIEGPDEKDGKLVWTFRKAVGTKGAVDQARQPGSRLLAEYATVPQLLEMAALDTDLVSYYVNGTGWEDAKGALFVVKGGRLAREIAELFERQGLLTAGKPVVDGDAAPATPGLVIDLHPLSTTGITLIARERKRQVEQEGWNAAHDDEHQQAELSMAACAYAAPLQLFERVDGPASGAHFFRDCWPWDRVWDKRKFVKPGRDQERPALADEYTTEERIRNLAKAGALIAAEIDRLSRLPKAAA